MTTPTRLYLITPPKLDPKPFGEVLKAALDAGDVACLQLRLKDVPEEEIARAADILMPIAQARDTAFILNDRPDLAAPDGADKGRDVPQRQAGDRDPRRGGRPPATRPGVRADRPGPRQKRD